MLKMTLKQLQDGAVALAGLGQVQGLPAEAKKEVSMLLIAAQKALDKAAESFVAIEHEGVELANYIDHLPTPAHIMSLDLFKKQQGEKTS